MRVWGRTSVRPKALDQPYGKILSGKGLLLSTSGLQMRPCRTCMSDLILLYPAKSPRVRVFHESPWLIYLKWRYICAFNIRDQRVVPLVLDVYLHAPDVCQSLVFGINESSDVRWRKPHEECQFNKNKTCFCSCSFMFHFVRYKQLLGILAWLRKICFSLVY